MALLVLVLTALLVPACSGFAPSHPRTLAPSHPRTLAPSHLRTLAPSHPRTLAPSHPPTLVSPDLAVVTWNMNAGRGDLPALVADLAAGRLTGGTPRAFIVLLQEAVDKEGDPAPTLGRVAAFHLASFFSPVREFGGRVRGNAILSSIPLAMNRVIELPRARQPRAAVATSVTVGGQDLFVVSAHLENRVSWLRGGLFSDGARGRQATALIRALPAGAHGIVGGDMNTWLGPAEPAWKSLLTRFPDTPPPPGREATFRNRLVLDHLFFDLPDDWRVFRRVLSNAYGSDHHPVLGELVFEP